MKQQKKGKKISYKDLKTLQNHLNNSMDKSEHGAVKAKVHFKVGDRVHLKSSPLNGVITKMIYKDETAKLPERNYPYIVVKWDTNFTKLEQKKDYYDPHDLTREVEIEKRESSRNKKKKIESWYLKERNAQ